jgi:hypothetical protein
VPLFEVERDGRRAGLVAATVQLLADLDDLVLDRDRRAPRTAQRPPRPWFQPGLASARYRCTSVITQRRETPYWRATSLLLRRSTSTAATTNCGMPIVHSSAQGVNNVPRQL